MIKYVAGVAVMLGLTAMFVLAQSAARKPNTSAPTKVTGDGVKTDSGLVYWDIRVGNGERRKKAAMCGCTIRAGLRTGRNSTVRWMRASLLISPLAMAR